MNLEDRAQEQELKLWETINVNRPKQPDVKNPGEPGYGPAECVECGFDMHPVRRGYGYQVCTPCQSEFETGKPRRLFTALV